MCILYLASIKTVFGLTCYCKTFKATINIFLKSIFNTMTGAVYLRALLHTK